LVHCWQTKVGPTLRLRAKLQWPKVGCQRWPNIKFTVGPTSGQREIVITVESYPVVECRPTRRRSRYAVRRRVSNWQTQRSTQTRHSENQSRFELTSDAAGYHAWTPDVEEVADERGAVESTQYDQSDCDHSFVTQQPSQRTRTLVYTTARYCHQLFF